MAKKTMQNQTSEFQLTDAQREELLLNFRQRAREGIRKMAQDNYKDMQRRVIRPSYNPCIKVLCLTGFEGYERDYYFSFSNILHVRQASRKHKGEREIFVTIVGQNSGNLILGFEFHEGEHEYNYFHDLLEEARL